MTTATINSSSRVQVRTVTQAQTGTTFVYATVNGRDERLGCVWQRGARWIAQSAYNGATVGAYRKDRAGAILNLLYSVREFANSSMIFEFVEI